MGVNETTVETQFYDITDKINLKPERYGKVFLCDQPGIGGLKITEAGYLANFGPGMFSLSFDNVKHDNFTVIYCKVFI